MAANMERGFCPIERSAAVVPSGRERSRKENGHGEYTTDKITGRVKEAVGVFTDNDRLKREGQANQVVGGGRDECEGGLINA